MDPLREMQGGLGMAAFSLHAKSVTGTRIIAITTESTIPEIASNFVNTLAIEYIAQNTQLRSTTTQKTSQWLESQLEETKVKLEEAQSRLDAFVSFFVEDGLMTAALLGYDLNRPRKLGLYRLAFALLIDEASRRKVLLNMSGGAGDFKMLRGAELVQEYDAVYDRHLPFARRLRWGTVYLAAQVGRLLP